MPFDGMRMKSHSVERDSFLREVWSSRWMDNMISSSCDEAATASQGMKSLNDSDTVTRKL